MKKIFPIIILSVIILYFFKSVIFQGLFPIPSDTIVGLYNPYRDYYAKDYPRGIPFKNFLITDPVRQEYPWRNLAITIEKQGQIPLWNRYSFAGTPLLANMQSAAFYPLNILLFILPFSIGWSTLVLLQPLLAGVFLYLYLQKMRLSKSASFLGATSFAFSGFFVVWLEWNTILHVALWLPLILLIKEILLEKFKIRWAILLILVESSAIFAGHLQTLFYAFIVSNVYLWVRILQISWEKNNLQKTFINFWRKYAPLLALGIFMYAITAIQWIPTFQFISLSARDIDQTNWMIPGWFIPWQNAVQFLAPDFFGNPTTLNYWGVWNYAEFVGYIGIIPLLFALFALFFRRDKKTFFFGGFLILSLLFAFPTPLAQLPFILHIPFISTSQPTRLLFVVDFCLAILAALGFDFFIKEKRKTILVSLSVLFTSLGLIWVCLLLKNHFGFLIPFESIAVSKRNLIFPSIIVIFTSIIVLLTFLPMYKKSKKIQLLLIYAFIIITVVDQLRFAQKFNPFTNSHYLFPQTKTITFLQQHQKEFRIMSLDNEILPPNFHVMYQLQSIEGYDPLYLKSYAEYIAASERGEPNSNPPFGFNRIITPHRYNSPLIQLLGVKYILSLHDLKEPFLQKVFQEGETRTYLNTRAIPRAFFVHNVLAISNKQQTMKLLFDQSFQPMQTAIIDGQSLDSMDDLSVGNISELSYQADTIMLQTNNNKSGFLVLTDIFYPTWHAYIDEKETKIYKTDYMFRGIRIPAGNHTIRFSNRLF